MFKIKHQLQTIIELLAEIEQNQRFTSLEERRCSTGCRTAKCARVNNVPELNRLLSANKTKEFRKN